MGRSKEDEAGLLSVMPKGRTRDNGHKCKKKTLFTVRVAKHQNIAQTGCGVSILQDAQNLPEHNTDSPLS